MRIHSDIPWWLIDLDAECKRLLNLTDRPRSEG